PPAVMAIEGRLFELHPAENYTDYRMFVDRKFAESQSISRLRDLVKGRRCLMLDVGMNSGLFTLALAPEMAPESRVVGVEANASLRPRIERNLALNSLGNIVDVHYCAVGAEPGIARLRIDSRNLGASTVLSDGEKGIKVPMRRLADITPEDPEAELFLVKIDIEGSEDAALVPFLNRPDGRLPDYIMLEVLHKDHWKLPLEQTLAERGYHAVYSGEGNTLFALNAG
ncbi:FkbM family methyltransferase, partial [Rhodovulum sp.]|uniref:FkbM family methyltransferase n=1 Tax=Rhodovulum sp. TaxID=34009 RepID=UPI00257A31E3